MALGLTPQQIINKNTHPLLGISENWTRVELNIVANIQNGYAFSSKEFSKDSGLPLIRIRDILKDRTEDFYTGNYLPEFLVNKGDILIGMDGDFNASVWKGSKGLLNQRVCRIIPSSKYYFNKFLIICLQPYLDAINSETSAVTVKHLSSKTIQQIPLPLPPLPEQQAIVSKIEQLFSGLDNSIDNFKKAHDQLKLYRQSVLKAACEGRLVPTEAELARIEGRVYEPADVLLARILEEHREKWNGKGKCKEYAAPETSDLSELPDGWIWANVGQIAFVGTGATPLTSKKEYYENGTIPWITSSALNEFYIKEPNKYVTKKALQETNISLYPKHTILVAMYGEGKTRGKCSELLIEATTNQAIASLVLDGTSGECRSFLKIFLIQNYDNTRMKSSGGVQPNLNLGHIKK